MHQYMKIALQTGLLLAISFASNLIAEFSGLPIPGNVVGVVLLFVMLLTGIIKLEYIQEAADFLLKHLVFFFVAVVVGLMNYGHIFTDYGLALAGVILASTILPFWTVGYAAQFLHRKGER